MPPAREGDGGDGTARAAVRASCADAAAALERCRASIGLAANECYPAHGYDGRCDGAEEALTRCVAFVVAPQAAAVFYDQKQPRGKRRKANKQMHAKMRGFR